MAPVTVGISGEWKRNQKITYNLNIGATAGILNPIEFETTVEEWQPVDGGTIEVNSPRVSCNPKHGLTAHSRAVERLPAGTNKTSKKSNDEKKRIHFTVGSPIDRVHIVRQKRPGTCQRR